MSVQKLLNPEFIGDDTIRQLISVKPDLSTRLKNAFNNFANRLKPQIDVNVHYLSDNGGYPDTAKIEIKKRLTDINAILSSLTGREAPKTEYHDIPAQDWRAGAFDLAQLTRDTVRGPGNVIFLNCAPRRKERKKETNNKGESVYIGMHRNGTIISAVSEDSFTLFRDLIEKGDLEIYRAGVQIEGSQFRSRDYFPWLSQMIATNLQNSGEDWKADLSVEERRRFLEKLDFVKTDEVLTPDQIADFKQEPCVLRADCHGNLKLSIRAADVADLPLNELLEIEINGEKRTAILKEGMFDPNDISPVGLALGSSGDWPDSDQGKFLELALMGKSLRDDWNITDQGLKEGVAIEILGLANNNPALEPEQNVGVVAIAPSREEQPRLQA